MSLPKHLEEKKKQSAEEVYHVEQMNREMATHAEILRGAYGLGFNAAAAEMLGDLREMAEALGFYDDTNEHGLCWPGVNDPAYIQDRGKRATETLAKYKAKYGSEDV